MFGSTSPLHTPPLNERARVLWLKDELQLDCMPCFDRTCRFGHYRCLTSVAPIASSKRCCSASASGATTSPAPPSRREGLGREHPEPLRREFSPRARTCQRRRSAPSAAPVGDPPAGSTRDRERVGAGEHLAAQGDDAAAARQHAERARRALRRHRPQLERAIGLQRDRHDRPRHQVVPSPLMLATIGAAGGAARRRAGRRRGRRRSAARTARGLASSTARPIAATLANAVRPRQNESRSQAPRDRRSSCDRARSEMRRQTSPDG